MSNNVSKKILLWFPRIAAIIYICFLSLFAFDVFTGERITFQMVMGFLVHILPSAAVLGVLIVAWKFKLAGGVLFLLAAIVFTIFFNTYEAVSSFAVISFPLVLIGAAALTYHFMYRGIKA